MINTRKELGLPPLQVRPSAFQLPYDGSPQPTYEHNYELEREGSLIYLRNAFDFHLPNALIWTSDIPLSAAKKGSPNTKTVTLVTHEAKATGFECKAKHIRDEGSGHWAII